MDWPSSPVLLEGVPAAVYHADQLGDVPTLSRSIAHALLSLSPAHAFAMHPRLGGNAVAKESKAMDAGSLVHALLLGEEDSIAVCPVKDFRTDAARAMRDYAREEGRTPVIAADYEEAQRVVRILQERLGNILDIPFWPPRHREATVLWEEEVEGPGGGFMVLGGDLADMTTPPKFARCRGRLDIWQAPNVWDLKIVTKGPAKPETFIRYACQEGLDLQAAVYTRAAEAVSPELAGRVRFGFLLCELDPPHDVVPILAGKTLLALGASKWERACRLWARCLEAGEWPGRSGEVLTAEAPEWALVEESTKGGL